MKLLIAAIDSSKEGDIALRTAQLSAQYMYYCQNTLNSVCKARQDRIDDTIVRLKKLHGTFTNLKEKKKRLRQEISRTDNLISKYDMTLRSLYPDLANRINKLADGTVELVVDQGLEPNERNFLKSTNPTNDPLPKDISDNWISFVAMQNEVAKWKKEVKGAKTVRERLALCEQQLADLEMRKNSMKNEYAQSSAPLFRDAEIQAAFDQDMFQNDLDLSQDSLVHTYSPLKRSSAGFRDPSSRDTVETVSEGPLTPIAGVQGKQFLLDEEQTSILEYVEEAGINPESEIIAEPEIQINEQSDVIAEPEIQINEQSDVIAESEIQIKEQSEVIAESEIQIKEQSDIIVDLEIQIKPPSEVNIPTQSEDKIDVPSGDEIKIELEDHIDTRNINLEEAPPTENDDKEPPDMPQFTSMITDLDYNSDDVLVDSLDAPKAAQLFAKYRHETLEDGTVPEDHYAMESFDADSISPRQEHNREEKSDQKSEEYQDSILEDSLLEDSLQQPAPYHDVSGQLELSQFDPNSLSESNYSASFHEGKVVNSDYDIGSPFQSPRESSFKSTDSQGSLSSYLNSSGSPFVDPHDEYNDINSSEAISTDVFLKATQQEPKAHEEKSSGWNLNDLISMYPEAAAASMAKSTASHSSTLGASSLLQVISQDEESSLDMTISVSSDSRNDLRNDKELLQALDVEDEDDDLEDDSVLIGTMHTGEFQLEVEGLENENFEFSPGVKKKEEDDLEETCFVGLPRNFAPEETIVVTLSQFSLQRSAPFVKPIGPRSQIKFQIQLMDGDSMNTPPEAASVAQKRSVVHFDFVATFLTRVKDPLCQQIRDGIRNRGDLNLSLLLLRIEAGESDLESEILASGSFDLRLILDQGQDSYSHQIPIYSYNSDMEVVGTVLINLKAHKALKFCST